MEEETGTRELRPWNVYCQDEEDAIVCDAYTARDAVEQWAKANGGFEDGQEIAAYDLSLSYGFKVTQTNPDAEPEAAEFAVERTSAPAPPSGETGGRADDLREAAETLRQYTDEPGAPWTEQGAADLCALADRLEAIAAPPAGETGDSEAAPGVLL